MRNMGGIRASDDKGDGPDFARTATRRCSPRAALVSFAAMTLLASCVDLTLPPAVSTCLEQNKCSDRTGGSTGGQGGSGASTAGAGGSFPFVDASAGVVAGHSAAGNSAGVRTGGGGGGAGSGGATGGMGGNSGEISGGRTAGTSGSPDGGTEPSPDADVDRPIIGPEVSVDTFIRSDTTRDTATVGPDVAKPEPSPDASADIKPEPGPDSSFDISPDRLPDSPVISADTPTCIEIFKGNGYALPSTTDAGVQACADCKENGISQETQCKAMVDCLRGYWVCKPNTSCWNECLNRAGDAVLGECVTSLLTRACPGVVP